MADRNGYIGRAPGDSSVVVARQTYTPGGIQTDFTFDSGYTVGYLDAYINGVRQIEATDYTAGDGSNVGFTSYLISGDTLELVAYKAFNVNDVNSTPGNFTVGNDLTVDGNVSIAGITTLGSGTSVSYATTSFNLSGSPDVTVNNITGVAATFSGNVTVGGSLIYDDVTNVDSWGIVTARSGLKIGSPTGVGATLGVDDRGSAIFAGIVTASSFSGDITGNATGLSGTPTITVQDIVVNSGVITATTGFAIGIESGGTSIANPIKTINFVGTGNTVVDRGSGQVDISISGSSGGGGTGELDITSSLFV